MRFELAEMSWGWREGLLGLIALLALYMLFELVRIRRLRQRRAKKSYPPPIEPSGLGENATASHSGASTDETLAWAEPPTGLVQEALMRGMENELAQMRDELDTLRGEFSALREELRHEVSQLRASQTVSPLYSDAMQMAINGYGVEGIAERCGISRAEAELVVSLVKNQET